MEEGQILITPKTLTIDDNLKTLSNIKFYSKFQRT